MTALTLYQITDEYQAVIDRLLEAGGELTPEFSAELDAITDAFAAKVEKVALYTRNLEALADAAAAEAKRLHELASSRQHTADGLKRYLLEQLDRVEQTKVVTPLAVVRVQKNSRPSIRWFPETDPPEGFVRVVRSVDLQRAYEVWKAGTPLPEGFSVEEGRHLRIT